MAWEYADVMLIFFNDTATTEIYPLSLHDALPISLRLEDLPGPLEVVDALGRLAHPRLRLPRDLRQQPLRLGHEALPDVEVHHRSEEHTSELQSRPHLVCRPLLAKRKHHLLTDCFG